MSETNPTNPLDPLVLIDSWSGVAAAGYVDVGGTIRTHGRTELSFEWASVTKVVTAMAIWIAVEEGITDWDEPAGPPGSTIGHLLSHASGLAPDSDEVLSAPGRRRIYSNRGIEVAARQVGAVAGMPFEQYATEAVLEPLGMSHTRFRHPAWGANGPLGDLLQLARELLRPSLISEPTHALATAVARPGLSGVLPGFGSQTDNVWGLGVEIRDHKHPHWTGTHNSSGTFGHFGRSGSFIWVDPDAGVAAASLSEEPFGPWAAAAWPVLSDAILAAEPARPASPARPTDPPPAAP